MKTLTVYAALFALLCQVFAPPVYTGRAANDLSAPVFLIPVREGFVYLGRDELGRPRGASALLGPETLTDEARGSLPLPVGFISREYEFIPGFSLYNRCHIIAHALGGSDAPENIFTGTQRLNISGMLPVETRVRDYIRATGEHVRYEARLKYSGDNLICDGAYICARSVESDGLSIAVFAFNAQPGVAIDYANGLSQLSFNSVTITDTRARSGELTYILNTHTRRFHRPECASVKDIKPKNRQEYYGSRELLIENDYKPCGACKP